MNLLRTSGTLLLALQLATLNGCKKTGPAGPAGSAGPDGATGLTSLIRISENQVTEDCPQGGLTVYSGVDKNKNNILEDSEVDQTKNVCNGVTNPADKQIFLPIEQYGANTTSTDGVVVGGLLKFSPGNYPGVDSIIMVANPYVGDVNNTSHLELYNRTDNQPIPNSLLSSGTLLDGLSFQETGNLLHNFPDKEIHVGFRVRSATQGKFAASGSVYLVLYRR